MERLLAGCYRAVWGFAVRKKSGQSGAKWVKRNVRNGENELILTKAIIMQKKITSQNQKCPAKSAVSTLKS